LITPPIEEGSIGRIEDVEQPDAHPDSNAENFEAHEPTPVALAARTRIMAQVCTNLIFAHWTFPLPPFARLVPQQREID